MKLAGYIKCLYLVAFAILLVSCVHSEQSVEGTQTELQPVPRDDSGQEGSESDTELRTDPETLRAPPTGPWPTPHEEVAIPSWSSVPAQWFRIDDDFPISGPRIPPEVTSGYRVDPDEYVLLRGMGVPANQAQADSLASVAPAVRRLRLWESSSRGVGKREVDEASISSLVFPNLELVELTGVLAAGRDVSWLPSVAPQLRRLVILDCNTLTDELWQVLATCHELRYLEIRDRGTLTGAGIGALKGLPLEHLVLDIESLDRRALEEVAKLNTVTTFELDADDLTVADMQHIAAMPGLKRLNLDTTEASNESMVALTKSKTLREFFGYGEWLLDTGVEHLARVPRFRELKWGFLKSDCRITDNSLKALANAHELDSLSLTRCPFLTDEGFAALSGHPQLKTIYLSLLWETTDATIEHLATLPAVETIELLNFGDVSPTGFLALAKAEALRRVRLYSGSGGMDEPAAELRELRPDLIVTTEPNGWERPE